MKTIALSILQKMQKKSEIVISENCIDLRIDDWANGEDNYFSENDKLESVVAKLAYESAKHSANSTCHMFFGQTKLPEKVKKLRKF
jgi:cyclic lactone autoinducer peptide